GADHVLLPALLLVADQRREAALQHRPADHAALAEEQPLLAPEAVVAGGHVETVVEGGETTEGRAVEAEDEGAAPRLVAPAEVEVPGLGLEPRRPAPIPPQKTLGRGLVERVEGEGRRERDAPGVGAGAAEVPEPVELDGARPVERREAGALPPVAHLPRELAAEEIGRLEAKAGEAREAVVVPAV